MLIKEYRIPLPLSVEEYRIAQLYMIQKKSREESKGKDSGVEIIKNEPYSEGPGGSGQYTQKKYHISSHVPGWVLPILPKDSLIVIEEAWNAYPYTKTRFSCPLVEKFMIEMETLYLNDGGQQENVFSLNAQQRKNIKVDLIDIVKEQQTGGDYVKDEDPLLYQSTKSHRGPLQHDWLEKSSNIANNSNIMCAYKMCKVEFKYWGMQTKMEKFVHDIALRKTMLRAHKQAWCWQDEWFGLTIEDIRKLEHQTQLSLKRKFQQMNSGTEENQDDNIGEKSTSIHAENSTTSQSSVMTSPLLRRNSNHSLLSINSKRSESLRIEGLRRDSIESTSSSSSLYFDAYDESPESLSDDVEDDVTNKMTSSHSVPDNMEEAVKMKTYAKEKMTSSTLNKQQEETRKILVLVIHGGNGHYNEDPDDDSSGEKISSSKQNDVQTMQTTFDNIISRHYKSAANRMIFRLVSCPNDYIMTSYQFLNKLNPNTLKNNGGMNGSIVTSSLVSMVTTNSHNYHQYITSLAQQCNFVYDHFLMSPEGKGFNGKVCIIADTIGSVLAYDMLCACAKNLQTIPTDNEDGTEESFHSIVNDDGDVTGNIATEGNFPDLKQLAGSSQLSSMTSLGSHPHPRHQHPRRSVASCSIADDDLLMTSSVKKKSASFVETSNNEEENRERLTFDICEFFMLGSPLAIVLAMRHLNTSDKSSAQPMCQQIYNIFYSSDPSSARIEPFIDDRFAEISPIKIPTFRYFPYGDEQTTALDETLFNYPNLFTSTEHSPLMKKLDYFERQTSLHKSTSSDDHTMSKMDTADTTSIFGGIPLLPKEYSDVVTRWWGSKRIDYSLFSPDEVLTTFTHLSLAHLFHASFWESTDFAAFVLRQVFHQESDMSNKLYELEENRQYAPQLTFSPELIREKWKHKRTYFKIRNIAENHRSKDVLAVENGPQILHGRFSYGPLDMVSLNDESVEIFALQLPHSVEWKRIKRISTNNHGRITCTIPPDQHFQRGFYQIRMIVKGDLTYSDNYLAVIPSQLECVVFSIDGSFTTNFSIMANDPKVRPSAVDVVRRWQDMGYMILYVTARPDIQKNRVVTWLAHHNFPHGMIWFCDSISHSTTIPLGHKTMLLKTLQRDYCLQYTAAYGSAKDISVYQQLPIDPNRVFIVGKPKKQSTPNCTWLTKGYSVHLEDLSRPEILAPAKFDAKEIFGKRCFRLPLRRSKSKRGGSETT